MRWGRALAAVVAALLATLPVARAQTVAPPLVEYRERAFSSFRLANDALVPMTVVLEPFAFTVDSVGALAYHPFDSAAVKLRMSSTSLRLQPRSSATITYEVSADSLPAWFVLTSTFIPPRTPGLNIRAQLPHVVYLYQREPLRREDISVGSVTVDSAPGRVRVRVENRSARMGRMSDGSVRPARGDTQAIEPFPMFPHSVRWVEVPWTSLAPPVQVRLVFDGFALDYDVPVNGTSR